MPDTTPSKMFIYPQNTFQWKDVKTWMIRSQYNEMLHLVLKEYFSTQYKQEPLPNFLNHNYCLTLEQCDDKDSCKDRLGNSFMTNRAISKDEEQYKEAVKNRDTAELQLQLAQLQAKPGGNADPQKDPVASARAKADETQRIVTGLNLSRQIASAKDCFDVEMDYFCAPAFHYQRRQSLSTVQVPVDVDMSFETRGLTVGALMWLYYYERMGIFQILGALLDDYNYRGKYTISGSRTDKSGKENHYSVLLDMISSLHRIGICSNMRDRICSYQRVLGVSIENNLGIESERNTGFMQTFNKLIGYMLEYYKTKQLAQAIQAQSATVQPRSSVATQTSIRDTINVLKQQFEPFQYGRNQINTYLGISVVHATICLVNALKTEIGIPDQYEKPEEFIPAAYDILVSKRPLTLNESNRYIIYDNCASYGYRLLTDLETIDINQLNATSTGSRLDIWLNDVEGLVEGYKNASEGIAQDSAARPFTS